ncbi:MAG: carboxypeptidase regulatory-like domain-containing protein [Kofleriaceae bacterium]
MKTRGVALVVVLLLAAAGGFWWWKQRGGGETPATSTVTQPSGGSSSMTARGRGGTSDATDAAASASIVVTVSSDKGPLADATVRLDPEEGDVIVLRTDKAGVARADKLAVGAWEIAASAPGFEPGGLAARELVKDEVANVAITLVTGGATLTGTVTDATGGPVAGARVDAARVNSGPRLGQPSNAVATTTTGSDGKYQMTVSTGQLVVGASSPDYAPQSRLVDVVGAQTVADFSLVPGGVIEGIVRDERSKQPIAGATIDARRDGGGGIAFVNAGRARAVSGADGRFRLTGLRPGAYELNARAVERGTPPRVTTQPVVVGIGVAEQVTDIELLLGSGLVLSGIVVDPDDKPVPGVSVSLNGDGPGIAEGSDDKGAFQFVGLPPGRYFLIPTADEWASDGIAPVELTNKDLTNVKVRVRPALKVTGHVEPRQLCTINHEPDASSFGTDMPMLVSPRQTEANGDFSLPVSPAKAKLIARCPSGAYGEKEIDPKSTAPVVIEVKNGASIAGRVVDGKGQPVANATVMAAPDGSSRRVMIVNGMVTSGVQTMTNAQGAYEIVGLSPGPYAMSALDRGRPLRTRGKPVRVTLTDAEKKTGVDLAIDRPDGVIRGVVTGPDGKPLADAWVSVNQDVEAMLEGMRERDEGERESQSTMTISTNDESTATDFPPVLTDASGAFEIRGLPHAKYEVIAEAQAGALRGRASNVTPDATLTIQALGLTSLAGTVHGAKGPTAVFRIELDGPITAARTFTDGKFQFGRVDPGAYTLRVSSADGNAEVKANVVANKPTTVDVPLIANAVVTGKVVDADGKPLGGVGVVLIKDEGEGRTRISLEGPPPASAADGTFRVEGPAQPSALVLMTPPRPTVKRPLALEPGKTLDLGTIRVEPRTGSDGAPPP